MAAAFAHHPAFAIENDDVAEADAVQIDVTELPSLAEALARAAASEREAAVIHAAVPVQPDSPTGPAPATDRPAAPLVATHATARAPRRSLARGGILIGLLLAVVRFLLGRR
jgi:hypothetical protein